MPATVMRRRGAQPLSLQATQSGATRPPPAARRVGAWSPNIDHLECTARLQQVVRNIGDESFFPSAAGSDRIRGLRARGGAWRMPPAWGEVGRVAFREGLRRTGLYAARSCQAGDATPAESANRASREATGAAPGLHIIRCRWESLLSPDKIQTSRMHKPVRLVSGCAVLLPASTEARRGRCGARWAGFPSVGLFDFAWIRLHVPGGIGRGNAVFWRRWPVRQATGSLQAARNRCVSSSPVRRD